MRYRDSGVDIDKAIEAMNAIKQGVRNTWGNEVLSDVGSFGGLFALPGGYEEPVLVSSMDGVGTKLLVASMADRYDTVGQDLVNHCVNDILVQGARPLYFLDYIAAAKVRPEMVASVVGGLTVACVENGCALIGGETAEMPGVYHDNDFDLAGTIVGILDRKDVIDGKTILPGDGVFALPSSGLHTNGFSLARRVFFDRLGLAVNHHVDALGCTVADELLKVHRSYYPEVTALRQNFTIKGLAHITGGGVLENLPRILPDGCGARIETGAWEVPPVFTFLRDNGDIVDEEMYRVFNMGLGMLIVVGADDADNMPASVGRFGLKRVGEIVAGTGVAIT